VQALQLTFLVDPLSKADAALQTLKRTVERMSTIASSSAAIQTLGFYGRLAVRFRGLAYEDWERLGMELIFRNASATIAGVPAERIVNLQAGASMGRRHLLQARTGAPTVVPPPLTEVVFEVRSLRRLGARQGCK
jgi:hypothetical protein